MSRRRGRRWAPLVGSLIVALVVAALVLAVRDARSSAAQQHQAEQTWLALLRPLIDQSNRSGYQLSDLRFRAGQLGLFGLQTDLDQVVGSTSSVWRQVPAVSYPPQMERARGWLMDAMRSRNAAAVSLRRALTGAVGSVSQEAVISELADSGHRMVGSDGSYKRFYQALQSGVRRRSGLPTSTWIAEQSDWTSGALARYVTAIRADPSLTVNHSVKLVLVGMDPLPVGFGTKTTLPPTRTLILSPVIINTGNQYERSVPVRATVKSASGQSESVATSISMFVGQHLSVRMQPLAVNPDSNYLLSVTVGPVSGRSITNENQQRFQLSIAS